MNRDLMYLRLSTIIVLFIVLFIGGCVGSKDQFEQLKKQGDSFEQVGQTTALAEKDVEFYKILMEKLNNEGIYAYDSPKDTPSIDFTLKNLNGKMVKLSDFLGQTILLNFWATWCGPCRSEMPSMENLYKDLKNEGFVLLSINLQESEHTVQDYVNKSKVTFPVLLDSTGEIGGIYGAKSIPLSYLIDTKGFVVGAVLGTKNWNTDAIKEIIYFIQQRDI